MQIKIEGDKLILTLPLPKEGGNLSESKKNYTVGGTGGFHKLDEDGAPGFSVNVVLCRKNTEYVAPPRKR